MGSTTTSHAHDATRAAEAAPPGHGPFRLVAVALAVCALCLGGFLLVDWAGTFELKRIEVTGGSPEIVRAVEEALAPLEGESLVSLGSSQVLELAREVPHVLGAKIDRDFPHTVRVRLVLHPPVAVVRSGASAWVVSGRGQVLESIEPTAQAGLPRVWLLEGITFTPGERMESATALAATRAIARLPRPFPLPVVSARGNIDDLTLIVGEANGVEVRLGEAESLKLKLAVAARVLKTLPRPEAQSLAYLDVSVPERPVASAVEYAS